MTKSKMILENSNTLMTMLSTNTILQFFSFKAEKRVVIIAGENLGHAMSIAQTMKLGPCIIEKLDNKDGATMYTNQFFRTKLRLVA
jgi:ribosomal protein S4E